MIRNRAASVWVVSLLVSVILAQPVQGRIIYVDPDAPGPYDGSSWSRAYWCLQNALAVAQYGDEIRVAEGTYKPDQRLVAQGRMGPHIEASGDRQSTFQLIDGVTIKGGYPGFGQPDPNAQDIEAHETILSGDLGSDDVGVTDARDVLADPSRRDNSYHVVTARMTSASTVLCGITIAGGNANWPTAGHYDAGGGGMINDDSSPTVTDCTFINNSALGGGGVMNRKGSDPTLARCAFQNNSADQLGGGVLNTSGNPRVSNCIFTGNWAGLGGGGVCNLESDPTLAGCVFENNSVNSYGAGMFNNLSGNPTVHNCAFVGNWAGKSGGGVSNFQSDPAFVNCIFAGNLATISGGGIYSQDSRPTVTNCILSGNYALLGGGVANNGSHPILTNCSFGGNSGGLTGGGLYCSGDSIATVVNCILWGNRPSEICDSSTSGTGTQIGYSNVQGGDLGTGNISEDPLFTDADGIDNIVGTADDNLRLLPGSPCINTGDMVALPADITDLDGDGNVTEIIPWDSDGRPRVQGTHVDMGAYEGANPACVIQLSTDSLRIPEGGTATFTVALGAMPIDPVEVVVARQYGDSDITVKAGTLLRFDATNYEIAQMVTLAAAEDADYVCGTATIAVTVPGSVSIGVTVTEQDNDPAPEILFVDWQAAGKNNGTSWVDAFTDLQMALDAGKSLAKHLEIRVAAGTYHPSERIDIGDPRSATFRLRNNVSICGGYAGSKRAIERLITADSRDVSLYETVLSGDLNRDDRMGLTNDNAYHVVYAAGTDSTALLDGFTITAGNANNGGLHCSGGGICLQAASPTVTNCRVNMNAARLGGGVFNIHGRPTLVNCVFSRNVARLVGGGMVEIESNAVLNNCTFRGNSAGDLTASSEDCRGGGIAIENSSPTLINCTFSGNSSRVGGAMGCTFLSAPIVINCVFSGNIAAFGGGVYSQGGWPTLTGCTFSQNSAERSGSGILNNYQSHPVLTNCILWGDVRDEIVDVNDSETRIMYSNIQRDGRAWPGVGNINVNPLFVNPKGPDGLVGTEDDDLRFLSGSLCIDAGNNMADIDANTRGVQKLPGIDMDFNIRRFDHPMTQDQGNGAAPVVDMGAYEFGSPPIPSRLFVKKDIDGSLGTVWANAFDDLRAALQTARFADGRVSEIWVAKGTYTPASEGGDRASTFELPDGLALYGGFTGNEDPETFKLDDRNFEANATILSGDLSRNDNLYGPDASAKGDNCYHVVTATGGHLASVLDGFTIASGNASGPDADGRGGGLYLTGSTVRVSNCRLTGNSAQHGSCIYSDWSSLTLSQCTIQGNGYPSSSEVWMQHGTTEILGSVSFQDGSWYSEYQDLTGTGVIEIKPSATLWFADTTVRCHIVGAGRIQVPLGKELTAEGEAMIDLGNLGDPDTRGTIQCDGLLRMKDNASLINARVNVTHASFEGNAIIFNSVITAEAGAPYGQFFIEDSVTISGNEIHADGDRYMDMDRSVFDGLVEDNRIYVLITEGVGQTRGGLFELRGQDDLVHHTCGPDEFLCRVGPRTVPVSDPISWTLEELVLAPEAKLNLTNRFDFQYPFDSGGEQEVLYVRNLVLGEGAILNTAFNRIYYENLDAAETAVIKNVPLLGFSLNMIALDDGIEFPTRVTTNNFEHPKNLDYDRMHVKPVTGLEPDPNGMMQMCNLKERDPDSPRYGEAINARAKALFAKASEDQILVMFEYLFETADPDAELVIYLSDVPELLGHSDPSRDLHYIEVGRLRPPPPGRPGSAESGRFGVFQKTVSSAPLNFIRGVRVEFELIGPEGTCILINDWDPQVQCYGICKDVTWDNFVDTQDFLTVIREYGLGAGLSADGNSRACLEGAFNNDGYVDLQDVSGWDWTLNLDARLNLCDAVPLTGKTAALSTVSFKTARRPPRLLNVPSDLRGLLIMGKGGANNVQAKLEDRLHVLSNQGESLGEYELPVNRGNTKLVMDSAGGLYQLTSEGGLIHLPGGESVLPSGRLSIASEPRYGVAATVSVGLQGTGADVWGRPVLDAAFDSQGYLYVVPVVVQPVGAEAYLAAAKLELNAGQTPPYTLIRLYDDPPLPGDNQERNSLREIEVDSSGNVYVTNSHHLNESDILWVFDSSTGVTKKRLSLAAQGASVNIPAPIALCASQYDSRLYLASSKNSPDAVTSVVYGLSADTLGLERTITINGMGHVTGITEDPVTGTLWVTGFTMWAIPENPNPFEASFYRASLAEIPYGSAGPVQAMDLSSTSDLALPMSILWAGTQAGATANLKPPLGNLDGTAGIVALAGLVQGWLE
jgi:hypothetical protein